MERKNDKMNLKREKDKKEKELREEGQKASAEGQDTGSEKKQGAVGEQPDGNEEQVVTEQEKEQESGAGEAGRRMTILD